MFGLLRTFEFYSLIVGFFQILHEFVPCTIRLLLREFIAPLRRYHDIRMHHNRFVRLLGINPLLSLLLGQIIAFNQTFYGLSGDNSNAIKMRINMKFRMTADSPSPAV